jgi:predicted membrane-bound spermidine synthase
MTLPDEEVEVNRLDNQALVRYYETEWRRFE